VELAGGFSLIPISLVGQQAGGYVCFLILICVNSISKQVVCYSWGSYLIVNCNPYMHCAGMSDLFLSHLILSRTGTRSTRFIWFNQDQGCRDEAKPGLCGSQRRTLSRFA